MKAFRRGLGPNNGQVPRQMGVGPAPPRIARAAYHSLWWMKAHHLRRGMHARISASGHGDFHRRISDSSQGVLERRLNAWRMGLALQPAIGGAVVFNDQANGLALGGDFSIPASEVSRKQLVAGR